MRGTWTIVPRAKLSRWERLVECVTGLTRIHTLSVHGPYMREWDRDIERG